MTRRRRQAGFTLIELMVALVVSTLLVGMILSIFSRMSLAYRGQQQISSVQQVLAAARASMELDAKQTGLGMAQGYWIATDNQRHSALEVINKASGFDPDEIRFVYADLSMQGLVKSVPPPTWTTLTIDANPGFVISDLVVVSTTMPTQANPISGADIAIFDACILKISGIDVTGTVLTFSQVAPWGTGLNAHCAFTNANPSLTNSMVYKVVTHAYRIDPDQTQPRAGDGVLQMSPTGDLVGLNDWQDLAYGFTDIQVAIQYFELGDAANSDLQYDTDPTRDFYSGDVMAQRLQPIVKTDMFFPRAAPQLIPIPIQLSMTLVARTDKDVEGIATGATPRLMEPLHPTNNRLGDHDTVSLPSATDPHLLGSRIYRYTTFQVDLRNLGVGL